jgi:hypothetical protein
LECKCGFEAMIGQIFSHHRILEKPHACGHQAERRGNSARADARLTLDDSDANSFALHRVRGLRFGLRGGKAKRDCEEIWSQEVPAVS